LADISASSPEGPGFNYVIRDVSARCGEIKVCDERAPNRRSPTALNQFRQNVWPNRRRNRGSCGYCFAIDQGFGGDVTITIEISSGKLKVRHSEAA
jgi:hypothetical protein